MGWGGGGGTGVKTGFLGGFDIMEKYSLKSYVYIDRMWGKNKISSLYINTS